MPSKGIFSYQITNRKCKLSAFDLKNDIIYYFYIYFPSSIVCLHRFIYMCPRLLSIILLRQGLQKCAGLDRLVRQTELISHIESMLFTRLLHFLPKKFLDVLHQVCRIHFGGFESKLGGLKKTSVADPGPYSTDPDPADEKKTDPDPDPSEI